MIFEKPSTRTRCAFTVGACDEGGIPTYLSEHDIQLGHKESIQDTARVLGRMFDGIEFRGFKHEHVEALAKYSGVPVWNGLTDEYHPTQILADLFDDERTFWICKRAEIRISWRWEKQYGEQPYDRMFEVGVDFVIIAPKKLWPEKNWLLCVKGTQKKPVLSLCDRFHRCS